MFNKNGESYISDVARRIEKFDIYICDLGDVNESSDNTLAKKRPCVITSSNTVNNYKANMYQISPIRTEHRMEVNEMTVDEIVEEKRKIGKIYIPIEMTPGDWRFIDITQTKQIPSKKVYNYKYTIINEELRDKINDGLYELFLKNKIKNSQDAFNDSMIRRVISLINKKEMSIKCGSELLGVSKNDLQDLVNKYNEMSGMVSKPVEGNKRGRKPIPIPTGFSIYYTKYKNGEMTVKTIANKMHVQPWKVYEFINKYKKLQDSLR